MKEIQLSALLPSITGKSLELFFVGMMAEEDLFINTYIPFIGAGVLGSAVGMDKDVTKRLQRDAGIPIAKFLVFHKWDQDNLSFPEISRYLACLYS